MANNPASQLDQNAMLLTKAIGMQEGGGQINYNARGQSGEMGAYQWMPATWQEHAKAVLGNANAPMTPENQNQVAYTIVKSYLDKGYTPAQAASMWNAGRGAPNAYKGNSGVNGAGVGYDTGAYVQGVQKYAEALYNQQGATSMGGGSIIPTAEAATPGDSPDQGMSVGGFLSNAVSSAGNLIGGLAHAVMHPIDTLGGILQTAAGGGERLAGLVYGQKIDNADTQAFDNMVHYFGQRYGGDSLSEVFSNIVNTAYHDPVGMALDLSTVLDGIGGAVGVTAKATKIGELADVADNLRAASSALNPIAQGAKLAGKVAGPALDTGGGLIRSAISHSTGFDPSTISEIVSNPAVFSREAIAETSRGGVLDDVTTGLQRLENQYAETGKIYSNIEKSTQSVALPDNFLSKILENGAASESEKAIPFGWSLEQVPGKTAAEAPTLRVVADTSSKFYDPASVAAVQKFVDRWGSKVESGGELTPKEFLNMRQEAARLGQEGREIGTNKGAGLIGRAIEGQLNEVGRPQIRGLKEVDAVARPQITTIRKVTKDLFNADGTLKDRAASKVALSLNKEGLLARLEKVSPGITNKLEALKAVEDIERAMGIKVGTYARNVGEIFGVATGNIPIVVGMILTHPKIAMQILRGFGYTAKTAAPVLGRVRAILGTLPKEAIMEATKVGVISNKAQATGQAPATNQ